MPRSPRIRRAGSSDASGTTAQARSKAAAQRTKLDNRSSRPILENRHAIDARRIPRCTHEYSVAGKAGTPRSDASPATGRSVPSASASSEKEKRLGRIQLAIRNTRPCLPPRERAGERTARARQSSRRRASQAARATSRTPPAGIEIARPYCTTGLDRIIRVENRDVSEFTHRSCVEMQKRAGLSPQWLAVPRGWQCRRAARLPLKLTSQ